MAAKKENTTFIKAKDFNIKKFTLPDEVWQPKPSPNASKDAKPTSSNVYTVFPKYRYGEASKGDDAKFGETLVVLTPPIDFSKGGVLQKHEKNRPTDDKCDGFWIPLDEKYGGTRASELMKMCRDIDTYTKGKGTNFLKGPGDTVIGDLEYSAMENHVKPPVNSKEPYPEWSRLKIRLKQYDIANPTGEEKKSINVTLRVHDDDDPKKFEEIVVTDIETLRTYLRVGCQAQFVIRLSTFWATTQVTTVGKLTFRQCGYKFICDSIKILKKSKLKVPTKFSWDECIDDEGDDNGTVNAARDADDDAKAVKKVVPSAKTNKAVVKDESEDEESGSESDTPKGKTKKPDAKKADSSDDEEPKKKPDPKKKVVSKPESEDDDDDDDEPPAKTAPKKDESDNEESPAKANVTKKGKSDSDEPPAKTTSKKGKQETDSESEDDTPAPPKKVAPKKGSKVVSDDDEPPKKTVTKKGAKPDSDSEDDKPTPAKKGKKVVVSDVESSDDEPAPKKTPAPKRGGKK